MNYAVKTEYPRYEKIDSINIDNVINYLLEKKLLDNESIVDGALEIFDVSRKNRNIKIANRLGSDLFLKQANPYDNNSIITIKRESLLYAILQTENEFTSMVDIAPKIVDYDEKNNIMLTEFVHGNSWIHYITREANMKLEKDIVASLGKTIATFHRTYENVSKTSRKLRFLPRTFTFENLLIHPGPEVFINISQANLKLLKIIQRDPKIYHALEELFTDWSPITLIHGDIKFDNIIVTIEKNARKSIITDWEMASIGDPAWDVGSIFQEFIRSWLYALPITGIEEAQELLAMSTESLQNMQYALRIFWNEYIKVIQKNPKETNELLLRSSKFCAARLFQSAYEMLQSQSELNNTAIYMVQLGLNMLTNASDATTHLLGIPLKLEL
jgi:thiamine kinase-like enzyme